MARKIESYSKQLSKCPKCGFQGACELVLGSRPISLTKSAFGMATGGLSLLITGIKKSEPKKYLECPECHHVFKA